LGLAASVLMAIGTFLAVIGGVGLLIALLFGNLWTDRRTTPGTVVRTQRKAQ
jgi:hypothetical protein